jgi:serine/threonine-protein kinase
LISQIATLSSVTQTDEYQALIETIGVDIATLVTDIKGTVNSDRAQLSEAETDASLPRMVLAGPDSAGTGTHADLELKSTIGQGATATVWAAAQSSLRRTVAVKQLLPDRNTPQARALLLQEARITGWLEHPNIVPVHALGLTEGDSPLLIMKYIEGTPWRTSLHPLYATDEPPDRDAVERQLTILLQVTSAIAFAHNRGVLHRDLKPENVMLGTDDEVYVVDWGLAVALDPAVDLPLAADVSGIAGTPGYMAPEMAASAGDEFTVRTDVYLLGAILHELITGERRHEGETTIERLASAYRSDPYSYAKWVPSELAEICNRACAKNPDERHTDAAAFRRAIEDFLKHRGSRELAEEATRRLERLERAIEPAKDGIEISIDPGTWNQWSTEARFGYRQALRDWPENEAAAKGLQRLVTLLVRRELGRDNPKAAAELASELPHTDPELQAEIDRVDTKVRTRAEDAAAMAKVRHEQDTRVAVTWRRRASILNGTTLLLGTLVLFIFRITGFRIPGYPDLLVVTLVVTAVIGWGERKVTAQTGNTWLNRKLLGGVLRISLSVAVLFLLGWIADIDIVHAEAFAMLVCGSGALMLAHTVDRHLLWAGIGFCVTAVGVVLAPEWRGLTIAVGGLGSFGAAAWAWRKLEDSGEMGPSLD